MPKRPRLDDASEDALEEEVLDAISNNQSAAVAILSLTRKYNFDLTALIARLDEQSINLSFSNVNYGQMAPNVHLDPSKELADAPSFELYRSRIPTTLFRDIIADINKISRFLSPIFDCLVPLFGLHIRNTPDALLEGRWATKGRVEYQFIIFGSIISILFVESKGTPTERFNAIAQLIAECDAGDFVNQHNKLQVPIYGILYDGDAFEFFMFSRNTESPGQSSFFCGLLKTPVGSKDRMSLEALDGRASALCFMRDLRLICEIIFDLLLKSYIECLTLHYNISSKSGSKRSSLDGWDAAIKNAKGTLDMCRQADQHRAASEWEACRAKVESAMQMLEASVIAVPRVRLNNVLDEFTKYEAMVKQF
ncbi:uncharacterized protein EI90DRAFT_3130311 [Cantharellus anzutake]|uniref:uncharacterized protein n=1 Tax=Cantharellus anzutake TaxID=1750568 RepID=UPI00190306A2|nr:uncharacterized protein EI90DRAFT_3130311 [Cantharellus anzutake]KAF8323459.1 hypothetical protein EI90DRAFT_3130311 [Cantharellus anzutake]